MEVAVTEPGLVAGDGVHDRVLQGYPGGQGDDRGGDGGGDDPAGDHGDGLPGGHADRLEDAEVVDAFAGEHEYRVQHAESGQHRDQDGQQLDEGGVDVSRKGRRSRLSRGLDDHGEAVARAPGSAPPCRPVVCAGPDQRVEYWPDGQAGGAA